MFEQRDIIKKKLTVHMDTFIEIDALSNVTQDLSHTRQRK